MGLIYEEITGKIIGAAIAVHKTLGSGFLESVYENAMAIELKKRGISYEKQKEIAIYYDGKEVGKHRLDMIVDDKIIVEFKAIRTLEDFHFSIVRSYIRATGKEHGLIINFSHPVIQVKRVI